MRRGFRFQAHDTPATKPRAFKHLRTVTEYQVFPDWNALTGLLANGGPSAQPP